MLEIKNLSKAFKNNPVLHDINFSLKRGECLGLLGPNGAGKTTLLNLITGFLSPESGTITIFGEEITHPRKLRHIKKRIGLVPQEIALYEHLSVSDNLRYFGELQELSGKALSDRMNHLLKWIGLLEQQHEKVKTLSGGMKRRLNFISSLLHSPELLLVDEPTVGIDPHARIFIYDLISELKQSGTTLIYATHYIPEVEQLCNRAAVLNEGRMVALGTPEEILEKAGASAGQLESAFFALTRKELPA